MNLITIHIIKLDKISSVPDVTILINFQMGLIIISMMSFCWTINF